LRRGKRPRAASLRVHLAGNRVECRRNCRASGPQIAAGAERSGQRKCITMTIATERGVTAPRSLIEEKPKHRPVRKLRWFLIVGLVLALLVGGLVGFNAFRGKMIAQFFANNKPPPVAVAIAEAKTEVVPNLLTAVGDLAAVHQVNVT